MIYNKLLPTLLKNKSCVIFNIVNPKMIWTRVE